MEAKEILSRSDFFTGDQDEVRRAFHRLVAKWHPDVCHDPMAGKVMEHLLALRDRAMNRGAGTRARIPVAERILETVDGNKIRVSLHSFRSTDLGEILVGGQTISTLYTADAADIGRREAAKIAAFTFADDNMRKQMGHALPHVLREIALKDGRHIVIQKRGTGERLLSDLLTQDGYLDPKHAAWLCSGLLHIACWMAWSGQVHGAIGPDAILLDTATHNVRLTGGWGFSVQAGARPDILPERTVQRIPRLAVAGQTVDSRVDLEMIRATLGDSLGGVNLKNILPKSLFNWLSMPSSATAVEDYASWQKALIDAWGPRTFVEYSAGKSV